MNQADALRGTDGAVRQHLQRLAEPAPPDRVRELVVAWGKTYPDFGTVGALNLVKCLNWPSGTAPKIRKDLKLKVLLLGVQNDPIVGSQGVATLARPSSTPAPPASG